MFYYKVIPALDELGALIYKSLSKIDIETIVIISVRNKRVFGVIENIVNDDFNFIVKDIIFVSSFKISVSMIKYFAKEYYVKFGSICKMMIPISSFSYFNQFISLQERKSFKLDECYDFVYDETRLSDDQKKAQLEIRGSQKPVILFGVTGAGKTEVFLSLINNIVGQVLILVPEINLVNDIYHRLTSQYNIKADYWHSNLTSLKRDKLFSRIISNKVKVVVGTRSSVFLPFSNLDLIIIDESHDSSFKQSSKVLYNAKDIALYLYRQNATKLVLSSATPSLEDYVLYKQNIFNLVVLNNRYSVNPPVFYVEKIWNTILSEKLISEIITTIENKKQVLLFASHRGYAKYLLCKKCLFSPQCKNCTVSLSVFGNLLKCKYCDFSNNMYKVCTECKSEDLSLVGYGIERAFEYIQNYFPQYKVAYVTSDSSNSSNIISQFANREIDILLGTNIIAKGYNFPHLHLVGILNVDLGFLSGDLRSVESNFQLLSQVSGRAGRYQQGKVYVQTYGTKERFIQYLISNDYLSFSEYEIKNRGKFGPDNFIIQMIFSSKNEDLLREEVFRISRGFHNPLGPVRAQIYKHKNLFRYIILLVLDKKRYINLDKMNINANVNLKIDINPYNYL